MSYDSRWTGPLSIRHDVVMGIQVLAFDGKLDAETSADATVSVQDALDRAGPTVLDLRFLREADRDGHAVLRRALRRFKETGMPVAVVAPLSRRVEGLLERTRPEGDVPVEPSVSAAIEAVTPAWRPDGPRWTPEPATQVRPRRGPAR